MDAIVVQRNGLEFGCISRVRRGAITVGLTIHYGIKSRVKTADQARAAVERIRQLALDLPFDKVTEIYTLEGEDCDFEKQRPAREAGEPDTDLKFRLALDVSRSVRCPWSKRIFQTVMAARLIAFYVVPGRGSEWACFGLAQYPETVMCEYKPRDDDKFTDEYEPYGPGSKGWRFSWQEWERWRAKNRRHFAHPDNERFHKTRKVPTKLGTSWSLRGFCKTQYASEPKCGGVPNFIRCHVGLITLLDRIGELPRINVEVGDEGKYGRSYYSDDWQEADATGRDRTYTWHDGKYSVPELVKEVGEWNEMIAATFGTLRDMLGKRGKDLVGPIEQYQNFEQLEFRGQNQEQLGPFLRIMRELADKSKPQEIA